MIIVAEARPNILRGYVSWLRSEGAEATGHTPNSLRDWLCTAPDTGIATVRAYLLGELSGRGDVPQLIQTRSSAPIIAILDRHTLAGTLALFRAGVDDAVSKPVHIRELLARIEAVRRRGTIHIPEKSKEAGPIRVFGGNRDAEIEGKPFVLRRRQLRILQYLVAHRGVWVLKSQIYASVYAEEDVDPNAIHVHMSNLRAQLRERLGYDPIDSARGLGYRLKGR